MDSPAPRPTPTPHPPSPRQQRNEALRNVDAHRVPRSLPGQRYGYLRRHWRGDLPLAAAVIVSAALVWGLVQLVELASRRFPLTDDPHVASALWLLEVALMITGVLWWGVGVQRAAIRSVDHGGSMLVAALSGLVGVGAFAWVALFWMQSARHVFPDVWATLNGTSVPAAVELEAPARLLVRGDLEFGTTRAVKAALDARQGIQVVRLESRGGRVAEGLALGRLLRDRGLTTLVSGECSSACVTAFAGGERRVIATNARLGLHSAGGRGTNAASVGEANRRSDEFIASRGVDWRVLERGAAVAHDAIWFPAHSVLLASNLATDGVAAR
jgi:hypothetical protein